MKKVQTMSISEFLNRQQETTMERIIHHIQRNQTFYIQTSGMVIAFLFVGADLSFAASSGLDWKAHKIYQRICDIGKWIIVIKGGIDLIGSMTRGDLEDMKKKLIQYVAGYCALLGLPWLLDQAGIFFNDPSMTIAPSSDGK